MQNRHTKYIERTISLLFNTGNSRGLYIGKYRPPRGRKKYQPISFGGKNMKRRREKRGNVKEKGRKGKENEKRGNKRVK
jgi:hypothetical protein